MWHAVWLCLALLCARSAHGGSDAASLQVRRNVCFKRAQCNVAAGHPLQFRDFGRHDNATMRHKGLTVVLNANHYSSFDYSNYGHWLEVCLRFYYAASLRRDIARLVKGLRVDAVRNIVLPQIPRYVNDCGRPRVPGVFARGAFSEVYVALARVAAMAAARALGKEQPRALRSSMLYCQDLEQGDACFEAVMFVAPGKLVNTLSSYSLGYAPGGDLKFPAEVLRVGAQWQSDMRTMLGLPPPAPLAERPVLLLTRKNGPSWLNRDDVARELRQRVRSRGLKFVDAGHAEDLGRELLTSGWKVRKVRAGRGSEAGVRIGGQRSHRRRSKKPASARARALLAGTSGENVCYRIEDQVRLWTNASLVITPHGAHGACARNTRSCARVSRASNPCRRPHLPRTVPLLRPAQESNVVYLGHQGGLVESLNCAHRTNTFEIIGPITGVRFYQAVEKSSPARPHCEVVLGRNATRKFLDVPRRVLAKYDTLFDVVEHALDHLADALHVAI